ncbi:MAG: hypothetical protein ACFCVF_02610 [Kineosporiaceae bacterium]
MSTEDTAPGGFLAFSATDDEEVKGMTITVTKVERIEATRVHLTEYELA